MQIRRYLHATEFLEKNGPLLEQEPEKNNLMLGLAAGFAERGDHSPEECRMYAILDEHEKPFFLCLQTPPRHMILAAPAALSGLQLTIAVENLRGLYPDLPGVNAPAELAHAFAAQWGDHKVAFEQRIMRLTEVTPARPAPGKRRPATTADAALAADWVRHFEADAVNRTVSEAEAAEKAQQLIDARQLHFWEDGAPVAMTACTRPVAGGICIAYVYTPDDLRGRGYASNLVAALSDEMMRSGKAFCVLFSDRASATANKIYEAIGYQHVCDFSLIDFRA